MALLQCAFTLATLVIAAAPLVVVGQSAATAEAEAPKESSGKKAIFEAVRAIDSAENVTFDLKFTLIERRGDRESTIDSTLEVAYAAPNRLSIADQTDPFFVKCDGEDLMTRAGERFSVTPAPKGYAGLLRNQIVGMLGNGHVQLALHLLKADAARALLAKAQVTTEGEVDLDGSKVDLLHVVHRGFEWDLYLDRSGAAPRIVRIVPDMSRQITPRMAKAGVTIEADMRLSNWSLNSPLAMERWLLEFPEKAQLVESIFEEAPAPHPLVGAAAPDFTLMTPEGEEVTLSSLRDRVVILDFWATWCGPCVAAMPQLTRVSEAYADKGVAFFAVNLGEDAESVAQFFANKDFSPAVLLDSDQEVSGAYGVTGIPQSVVIGPDGKVQVIHVGLPQNLEGKLSSELDALLEGKDLAGEELAEHQKRQEEMTARAQVLREKFAKKRAAVQAG